MKHYTTFFYCLVLSAVLIFVPSAEAASISVNVYPAYSVVNATLTNQYTVDYEMDSTDTNYPYGNYNIATYEAYVPIVASGISVDSYINGASTGNISITPVTPSGATIASRSISFEPYSGNGYWSTAYNLSTTNISVRVMFDNYYSNNSGVLQLGVLHYFVSYSYTATPNNVPDPPANVSVSLSSSSSSAVGATPEPEDQGLAHIIAEAIVNGISDGSMPFDDILNTLENIRTQDQTNYTTIIQYLSDNDTFNSTLYQWLQNVLEEDFSTLLDDTGYLRSYIYSINNILSVMSNRDNQYYPIFNSMLNTIANKLQTLIDLQNAAGTQANNLETAAAGLENQINRANDYQAPNVNFMLTQADQIMVNGQSGMNLIATIVNEPWIVQILLVVVSLAFVGYLLYGKGV